jgi:hypothetical protein
MITLQGRYHYPRFIGEETEAQSLAPGGNLWQNLFLRCDQGL